MEELKNTLSEVMETTVVEGTEFESETLSKEESVSKSEKKSDTASKETNGKRSKTRKSEGRMVKKREEVLDNPEDSSTECESGRKSNKKTSETTASKEKKRGKAPSYSVEECGKKARQLGTSREVVLIALREAGKKEGDLVTYAEAKVIIRTFLKREVL